MHHLWHDYIHVQQFADSYATCKDLKNNWTHTPLIIICTKNNLLGSTAHLAAKKLKR